MNVPGYETVQELISFRDVVNAVPNGISESCWLVGATGGYHGTHMTLDDCELILRGKHPEWKEGGAYFTVLVINPAEVSIKWGEVKLSNLNEVHWLRQRRKETLEAIARSQEGN